MKKIFENFCLEMACFMESQSGASGIEYSLLAAGIALAIIFIVFVLGDSLQTLYQILVGSMADANARN